MPETDDELSYEAKTSMHAERSDRGKVGIVLYLDDESVSTFSDETKDTSMGDSKCSYRSLAELEQPNTTGKARKHICRICGHRKGKHRLSSKQKDRAREIIRKSKAANGGRRYVEPEARIEREESHDDDDDGVLTDGHEVKATSSLLERSPRGAFLDKFSIAEMLRDLDIRSELFSKRHSKRMQQGHSKDAAKPMKRSAGSRQMKNIPKGTTMSIPFKAIVNGLGGDEVKDDTPRERNTQDGTETRMIPTQDQATIGKFIYSKRDNDMPLAESRHYGITDVDNDQCNATNGDKPQDSKSEKEVGSSSSDIGKGLSGNSISCSLRNYSSSDYSLLNYISDGVTNGNKNNTEVIQSKRDHPVHDGRSTSTHIWSTDDKTQDSESGSLVGSSPDSIGTGLSGSNITCSLRNYSSPDYSLLNYISDGVMNGDINNTEVIQSKRDNPVLDGRSTSTHIWSNDDKTQDSGSSITCSLLNYSSPDYSILNYISDGAMSQSVNSFNVGESVSRRAITSTRRHDLSPDFSFHNYNSHDELSGSVSSLTGAEVGRMSSRIIDDTDFKGVKRLEDKAMSSFDVVKKTIHVSVGGRSRSEQFSRTSQFQKAWIETIVNQQVQNVHYPRNTDALTPRVDTYANSSADQSISTLLNFIHGVCGNTTVNVNIWSDDSDSAPPRKAPTEVAYIQPEVSTNTSVLTPSYGNRSTRRGDVRKSSIMTSTCDLTDTIPGSDLSKCWSKELLPSGKSNSSRQNDIDSIRLNQPEHGSTSCKESMVNDSPENDFVVPLVLSRNPKVLTKPQEAATAHVLRSKKPPTGTPMVAPCKDNVEVVKAIGSFDTPSIWLNEDSKTDNRRASTQSDTIDAKFVYSRRDNTIPLAESSHRLCAGYDNTIDDSPEYGYAGPSRMRGMRDVPMRRHTVHGKELPREENNAVVGETGAPFYRRNTIGTTEDRGRIKQGHTNVVDISKESRRGESKSVEKRHEYDIEVTHSSRDPYTPDTRRIRKTSDKDETPFLYSKRDHSIPLSESTHDRLSDYDNSVNTASIDNSETGRDVQQRKGDDISGEHAIASAYGQHDNMIRELKTILTPYSGIIRVLSETNVSDAASHVDSSNEEYDGNRARSQNDANNSDVIQIKRDHPVLDHRSTSTHIWSSDDDVLQSKRDDPVLDHRSTSTHIWSSDDDVLQSKLDLPVPDHRNTSTHIWSSDDDVLQSKRDDPVLDHRSTSTHIWSSDGGVLQSKLDLPVPDNRSTSTHIWSNDDVLQSKRDHPVLDHRTTSTHIWSSDYDVLQSKRDNPVLDNRSTSTHISLEDRSTSTHISLDDRSTSTHIWPSDDGTVPSKRDDPVLDNRSTSTHISLDDRSTSTHIWPSDDGTVPSKRDDPVLDNRSTSTHISLDDRSTSTHIWPSDDGTVQSKRDDPVLDNRSTSTHISLEDRSTSTHIWPSGDGTVLSKPDHPVLDDRSTSTHIWSTDDAVNQIKRDHQVLDSRSTSTQIWSNDDVLQSKRDHPVFDNRSASTHIWSNDDVLQSKRDHPVFDNRSASTHIWSNNDVLQSKRDHPVFDNRSASTHIWSNDDVLQSKRDHPVFDNRSTSTHIWSNDDVLQSKRDHPALDIRSISTHIWSTDEDVLQSKRDDPVLDIGSTSTHSLLNAVDDLRSKSDHFVPGDRNTGVQSATNNVELSSSECGRLMIAVSEASRLSYCGPDTKTVLTSDTELDKNATSFDHRRQNESITDTVYEEEHPSTTSHEKKSDSHLYDSNSRSLLSKAFDVQIEDLQQTKPITTIPQIEVTPSSNTTLTSSKGSMADVNETSGLSRHTRSPDISRSNLRRDKSTVEASHVELDHSEEHMTSTSNKPSEVDAPSSNQLIALVESTHSTISKGHNTSATIPTHDIEARVDNAPEQLVVVPIEYTTASRPDRTPIMGHSDHSMNKNVDAAINSHGALENKDVSMSDYLNTSSRKHSVSRRDSGGRSTVSYMDQHCRTMLPQDWHTDNRRKTITGVLPCPDHYISIGETAARNLDDFTAAVRGNASRTLSASSHSSASSQSSRHGTETQTSYSGSDVHDSVSTTHSASSADLEMAPTSLGPISELPNVEQNRVMSDIDEKQEVRMPITVVRTHQSSGVFDEDVRNRLRALQHATTTGDKLHLKAKSATEYLGLYDDVTFKPSPSAATAGIGQTADKPAQNTDGTNTICTYASDPVTVEVWRLPSHDPTDASTGDDVADVGTRLDSSTSGNLAVLLRDLTPESTQLEIAESAERILQRMLEVSACNFTVSSSSLACNVIWGRR